MKLLGGPTAILVDDATGSPEVAALLAGLGLPVAHDIEELRACTPPTVAVLSRPHPPVAGCYGWYVGQGAAPHWLHAVSLPRATARILGLLGTSLAQERAGAAFRAASAGVPTPVATPFDRQGVLDGITDALTDRPVLAARDHDRPDAAACAQLLRSSFDVLDRCCSPTGAIAAAPRSQDGPDYWFAWQRDAAHVAHALHLLSLHGPDDAVRDGAASRRDGWVRFVTGLAGGGLAASRRTMAGDVVGGYGDPQQDGPAATALVLLTVVARTQDALHAARPYLEHLLSDAADEPGFDLWELTFGDSFHAANLRRRALTRAARLAYEVGDGMADRYARASSLQARRLDRFRSAVRPGLVNVLNPEPAWFSLVSRLDMGVVGSALLAYDPLDDGMDVHASPIRKTFEQLLQWSAERGGRGIGRFPEDCNDGMGSTGGSPWTVTTLWAAQALLRRGAEGDTRAGLGYLRDVLAGDAGALGEQLDAVTGAARGAAPLAWAHAELVVTILALDATISPSTRPCG